MKGSTLRYIRNALNLTQTQLGELLGVTYATVNRWENGVHKLNAETLVLNVTGEDVIEIAQHMEFFEPIRDVNFTSH